MIAEVFCQLALKPCGAVSFNRLPRPQGFSAISPACPQRPPAVEESKGLSVSLTDAFPKSLPRAPRGSKGLTSYAKSLLVFSVSELEKKYSRRALTFWTATIPVNEPNLLKEILEKSKQLLKYLRDQLTKYLARVGLPTEVVLVSELQKRGALHFHAVFVGRLYSRKIDKYELDGLWKRVLSSQVSLPAGTDFSFSCRTEPVRKSVGRYLAKYLSKSVSKENFLTQGLSVTWYSVGNSLKRLYQVTLEQNKFPAVLPYSVFRHTVFVVQKLVIAARIICKADLLLGITGFACNPTTFLDSFLTRFPYLGEFFSIAIPS